mmetsp:Transcript_33793/g.52870  ORF Transcript_33793/g.52870 Transcript_33793/m.52870 type:complete len:237 (-) Transcript_33793:130-840(-)
MSLQISKHLLTSVQNILHNRRGVGAHLGVVSVKGGESVLNVFSVSIIDQNVKREEHIVVGVEVGVALQTFPDEFVEGGNSLFDGKSNDGKSFTSVSFVVHFEDILGEDGSNGGLVVKVLLANTNSLQEMLDQDLVGNLLDQLAFDIVLSQNLVVFFGVVTIFFVHVLGNQFNIIGGNSGELITNLGQVLNEIARVSVMVDSKETGSNRHVFETTFGITLQKVVVQERRSIYCISNT